jgi:hypothetical protein
VERVPADLVVFVGERRPVAHGLELPSGTRVQLIGDAVVPRRAAHAIAEGRAAADAILGRSGPPAFLGEVWGSVRQVIDSVAG